MSAEIRRISTPTATIHTNEADKSLHQFRSLRLDKRNIIRANSIILETEESKAEIRDQDVLPQRPTSCESLKIHTYNKTLTRNNSRYGSKKSIKNYEENIKVNKNNSLKVDDLTSIRSNSNLNRSISTATSNIIVREQYWSCCSRKWTRCEKILITAVTSLIIIVLVLFIVIGIISREEEKSLFA